MYMAKKSLGALALVVSMMAFSAHAQDSTNTSTSNVNTSSQQQATSSNAGVTAQVNSYGMSHQSINAQVPLSLGGYGSFSQSNCSNAVGVGATTKIFSFVVNAPKPEQNCQHMVRSDAFGRESQLAAGQHKPNQAEIMRALSVWQACTPDDETIIACIRMGSIVYVDPAHPDIHKTMPAPKFVDERIRTRDTEASVIPSRPAGWTGQAQGNPEASNEQASAAVNALPWVVSNAGR